MQVYGPGYGNLERELIQMATASRPRTVSVATAYLSDHGAAFILDLLSLRESRHARVIVSLTQRITKPTAIERLMSDGRVDVRALDPPQGIFHSKFLVGHAADGRSAVCHYLGSGNFTWGGLVRNLETGWLTQDADACAWAADAFEALWTSAKPINTARLRDYAAKYRDAMMARDVAGIRELQIEDPETPRSPPTPISTASARTVWAGLETFTGGASLQVEFPASAAIVLGEILPAGNRADFLCDDGVSRSMLFNYYKNHMHRLNVPGDVPLVDWVKQHHRGAAVVSRATDGSLSFSIVRDRAQLDALRERSQLVGFLGQTPTRLFGWY